MQITKKHIAENLRAKLPPDKQGASWGYLAEHFPWYPMLHLLRAADHPNDLALLQKAGLYAADTLRLHYWLQNEAQIPIPALPQKQIEQDEPITELLDRAPVEDVPSKKEEVQIPTEPTDLTKNEHPLEENNANPGKTRFFNSKDLLQHPEEYEQDDEYPDADNIDLTLPDLSKVLNQPVDENTPLLIEAYHTIDYFASQGIKVDKIADNQLDTQLDKQVKSFTDWLKTMKKVSYQPKVSYTDPLVEVKAKSSLSNKEVVTEAMAQVWVKQGNFANAARVYAKLMLLHPEKTPYFAARLQDLKTIQ